MIHLNYFKTFESIKVKPNEYVELWRDSDFVLIVPLTHNASQKYGFGTKWCTSSKKSESDFIKHTELGLLAYIVIRNNELKNRFRSNSFAMYKLWSDNEFIAFDDKNNEFRNGSYWLSNEFDKLDRLSQYYKMLMEFNKYFSQVSKK